MPERVLRPIPDPADPPGGFLRAWREQRGWTIDQVAWVLRIRLVYLEAIEADRFEELPGRIYVTGFVRSYAKLLGIDEEAIVRHLRSSRPEIDRPKALVFPEPAAERAVPGGALTAVGIMVATVIYAGWYYQTATSRSDRAFVGSVPARLIATADPLGDFRSPEQATLPATLPMQPPMRPPPTRTVSPGPSAQDAPAVAISAPAVSPERLPAPAERPLPAASVPRAVADASRTVEVPRGDPPAAGAASTVNVALADVGRPAGLDRVPGAADRGRVPEAASNTASSDGARIAAARTATTGDRDRAGNISSPPLNTVANWQTGTAPPRLPSAEMADAYAATLPADMIPVMRQGDGLGRQASPSASAAWAGSVDGLSSGQWVRPGIGNSGASGPVVLNAIEATWIEVREQSGQVVTGKLLQPGDSYTVPSKEGLRLTTGNAGGLQILVGGRKAPSVGPRGAVRRDIHLDGGLLLAGGGAAN